MIKGHPKYAKVLRAVLVHLQKNKPSLVTTIGCLVLSTLLPLLLPVLIGVMVDTVNADGLVFYSRLSAISLLNFLFGGPVFFLFLFAMISGLSTYLYDISKERLRQTFVQELRNLVFEEASRISGKYAMVLNTKQQFFKINSEDARGDRFLECYFFQPLTVLVTVSLSMMILLSIDLAIGTVACFSILLLWFAIEYCHKIKVAVHHSMLRGLLWLFAISGLAMLWWYGERAVLAGELSLGALVMSIGLVVLAYFSLGQRFALLTEEKAFSSDIGKVKNLLITSSRNKNASPAKALHVSSGRIKIQNLSYAKPGKQILKDICLDIAPNQITAIVGPEQAGKSTLIQLITRELAPEQGRVYIDDQAVSNLQLDSLRSQVVAVPALPLFFDGTVLENLCFMQPEATMDEVIAACDTAFALQYVESTEHGFYTRLGMGGIQPSSDELRRLAIARAILKRPKILLLDKPLSGLKSTSEVAMINTIRRLRGLFTVVVTENRLEKMRDADQVYMIQNGCLIDQGTPGMLLRRQTVFSELVGQSYTYCASPF